MGSPRRTCVHEVYIAMSGRVFVIDRVRKNREARRFEEIP